MAVSRKQNGPRDNEWARYLISYNQFAGMLWGLVLLNTILQATAVGQPEMFKRTNLIVTGVQTLAVVEIFNSLSGIVKSPVLTTVSQVFSRLLIVYGVFQVLPNSPANESWAYITVCLAWSITEVVRYFYYAQNIITDGNPSRILTWLRYNLFFVLYPGGVASELTLVYLSLDEAERVLGTWYKWFFIAVFGIYVPGFYTLFTHMIKQRSKVMKSLKTE